LRIGLVAPAAEDLARIGVLERHKPAGASGSTATVAVAPASLIVGRRSAILPAGGSTGHQARHADHVRTGAVGSVRQGDSRRGAALEQTTDTVEPRPGDGSRGGSDQARATAAISIVSVKGHALAESASMEDVPELLRDEDSIVWIDLTDPAPEVVSAVAQELDVHPIVIEDIVESDARAKLEPVGDVLHIVLFALTRHDGTRLHEVDFILGQRFLLTVHPATWDIRAAHQLRAGLGTVMRRGPDALLWALSDAIVDGYFPIFDQLADEIDSLEDRILERPDRETLQQVLEMKRELIKIRHVVAPGREVFNQLTNREYDLIREPQVLYFRDVYDHLVRLTDEFDSFRELTAATIELYLSTVNNDLTVIMKRLTGATVVLAGIAAIAGIFGMSEASSALDGREGVGFWVVSLVTLVIAGVVLAILRRIGWI
jgi:magnesium transporter